MVDHPLIGEKPAEVFFEMPAVELDRRAALWGAAR
jgi:hypothetical protein